MKQECEAERRAVGTKMNEPTLKKENTIGINYVLGEIEEHHYKHIIERILGVPEREIEGIDDRGTARFISR